MRNMKLSALEKQLADVNYEALQDDVNSAKAAISEAKTAGEIKEQICRIWAKIKPYIGILKPIPYVGKFIDLLEDLLDALCKSE